MPVLLRAFLPMGERLRRDEVSETLDRLVERSLLHFDPETGRYCMLESVREYGRDLLGDEELRALQREHLAWFARWARQGSDAMSRDGQAVWFARVTLEHENVRSALDWALAQGADGAWDGLALASSPLYRFFAEFQGHTHWARGWLERALASPHASERNEVRGDALNALGSFCLADDPLRARTLFEEALSIREHMGDSAKAASAMNNLGITHSFLGEPGRAREHYQRAIRILSEGPPSTTLGIATLNLASVTHRLGDARLAVVINQRAQAVARELKNDGLLVKSLLNGAEMAGDLGNADEEWRCLGEAVPKILELGLVAHGPLALLRLARRAERSGDAGMAAYLAGAAQASQVAAESPLQPPQQEELRGLGERLVRALGPKITKERVDRGRATGWEEALQVGLKALREADREGSRSDGVAPRAGHGSGSSMAKGPRSR